MVEKIKMLAQFSSQSIRFSLYQCKKMKAFRVTNSNFFRTLII